MPQNFDIPISVKPTYGRERNKKRKKTEEEMLQIFRPCAPAVVRRL